ncbi:hypothetical protein ACFE04_007482 [Oxalis oulophora]
MLMMNHDNEMMMMMKDRQRWQPEEDAILRSYVKQYGPKEWNLISNRMQGKSLNRDPKSCLERWKNYLKPGIKKGSLTPEEQTLVISLQAKYGNKWKKIASEVPGRTAKRLGKWWEVFKEKQQKQLQRNNKKDYSNPEGNVIPVTSPEKVAQGKYDHILETFAEKYVQPKLFAVQSLNLNTLLPPPNVVVLPDPDPVLTLGSVWMNTNPSLSTSTTCSTPSPSVSLTLSSSEPSLDTAGPHMSTLMQYCMDVEEGRQNWVQHKKEATWRLSRLEQQIESEKARKMKEKTEEIEGKIKRLRDEEMAFLGGLENEYRMQLSCLQREAECEESKLMEAWCSNHVRLGKIVNQIGVRFNTSTTLPK